MPCKAFAQNEVWLELCLTAADLLTWSQAMCFTGELATCEPATLRYRISAIAGQLVTSGRQWRLHLDKDWPWASDLATAFMRLRAAPWPAGTSQPDTTDPRTW